MTMERTLLPPSTVPYFKCSNQHCLNLWQPYHGKTGCLCYTCDNKTPERISVNQPTNGLITNETTNQKEDT